MKFNNKLVLLFICLQALPFYGMATSNTQQCLHTADSLFNMKKYTESFEIYDSLLTDLQASSPSMLVKMAFIKEGLGDYSQAEYYLNLYYLSTADAGTLGKMKELADANSLTGYDFDIFYDSSRSFVFKYFNILTYFLLALAILCLVMAYRQKFKFNKSSLLPSLLMVFVLGLLFVLLNFGRKYEKGIIAENNTYLMSGPSAGAKVIEIIEKGHRVNIKDTNDVWVKIEWDDKEVFVKTDKIRPITFL